MKTTTRIIDIITVILNNNCYSMFENVCKNQITYFNSDYSYFKLINNFNEEIYNLMNEEFFKGNVLKSKKADKEIKRIFFARFLNREIGRQTFEIFLSELLHILYTYDDILSFYYDNIEKYIQANKVNTVNNSSDNVVNNRSAFTTLPQNEVNLDLNNDLMSYGDNNTISKTKNTTKGESTNTLSDYDFNIINNLVNKNIVNYVMNKIDKKCFLQIW